MRSLLALLCATPLASLGCAFVDQNVSLDPPRPAPTAPATAGTVVLERLVDVRPDRERIGIVKNGYGMETANVVTDDDVPTSLTHALRAELEAAHFAIAAPGACGADALRIGGAVEYVMTEPIVGWTADVVAEVKIAVDVHRGGRIFHREFLGYGKKEGVMVWTEDDFEAALDQAIAQASRSAVVAVLELMRDPRFAGASS